jgi:hypothetical protein
MTESPVYGRDVPQVAQPTMPTPMTLSEASGVQPPSAAAPPFYRPDSNRDRREVGLVLLSGMLYVGLVFAINSAPSDFGLPRSLTAEWLGQHGSSYVTRVVLVKTGAVIPILFALWLWPKGPLSQALRPQTADHLMRVALISAAAAFVLNLFGLWPFSWRWATDSTRAYFAILTASREWSAFVVWCLFTCLAVPVIEEVSFRFGVLRYVALRTGSARAGIMVSAVLFGVAHLGYLNHIDRAHAVNASWVFVLALILGWLTVKAGGRVTRPIAVHVAINSIQTIVLYWFTLTGPS